MPSHPSVSETIQSVRAMIQELEGRDLFDENGHEIACRVERELAALAQSLDETDRSPPLFV